MEGARAREALDEIARICGASGPQIADGLSQQYPDPRVWQGVRDSLQRWRPDRDPHAYVSRVAATVAQHLSQEPPHAAARNDGAPLRGPQGFFGPTPGDVAYIRGWG